MNYKKTERLCKACGAPLKTYQKETCSRQCMGQWVRFKRAGQADQMPPPTTMPRKQLETDTEQAKLKREIDIKYGCCPGPVRQYQPGTPEWDEVVKTLSKPAGNKQPTYPAKNLNFQGAHQ